MRSPEIVPRHLEFCINAPNDSNAYPRFGTTGLDDPQGPYCVHELKFPIDNSVSKELEIALGYIMHGSHHHHVPLRKGKHP